MLPVVTRFWDSAIRLDPSAFGTAGGGWFADQCSPITRPCASRSIGVGPGQLSLSRNALRPNRTASTVGTGIGGGDSVNVDSSTFVDNAIRDRLSSNDPSQRYAFEQYHRAQQRRCEPAEFGAVDRITRQQHDPQQRHGRRPVRAATGPLIGLRSQHGKVHNRGRNGGFRVRRTDGRRCDRRTAANVRRLLRVRRESLHHRCALPHILRLQLP